VVERVVVNVEVVLGHHAEGADGGQRAAVLAVQFVDTVAMYDQFALFAARQVEVPHQALAWVVVAVAPRRSDMAVLPTWRCDGLFVKAPGGCRAGRFRMALSVRGVAPRGVQGVVVWKTRLGAALGTRAVGSARVHLHSDGASSRP
jgi:hypothetical protein